MYRNSGDQIKYSRVTSEPASEPVSVSEAKTQLKITGSSQDTEVASFIKTSREVVEKLTGRSLITQTRQVKLDYFPFCNFIELTNGPLIGSVAITYYDTDEVSQTLSSSDYWVDTHSEIPRVVIKNYWPATKDMPNAVTVQYVAGYGAASAVPSPLKEAMLMLIGHYDLNRQAVITGTIATEIPEGVHRLIGPYVVTQNVSY